MKLLPLVSLVAVLGSLSFAKPIVNDAKADVAAVDKRAPETVTGVVDKRAPEPVVAAESNSDLEARGAFSSPFPISSPLTDLLFPFSFLSLGRHHDYDWDYRYRYDHDRYRYGNDRYHHDYDRYDHRHRYDHHDDHYGSSHPLASFPFRFSD
jgi:hypothetical protein